MFVRERVEVRCPPMQGSLLSMGERLLPTVIGNLERTWLEHGAWFDHAPGWLAGADAWFDALATGLTWQHARRPMYDKIVDVPRLIWGRPTAEEAATNTESEIVAEWDRLSDAFAEHYRRPTPRLHANFYRDGNDSVAWHRDSVESPPDSLVAIISLGNSRAFGIRPFGGGAVHRFELGWGDLLVMGGSMQQHYEHAVPKSVGAAPRISVMIRS